jgi:hypothetical protein
MQTRAEKGTDCADPVQHMSKVAHHSTGFGSCTESTRFCISFSKSER